MKLVQYNEYLVSSVGTDDLVIFPCFCQYKAFLGLLFCSNLWGLRDHSFTFDLCSDTWHSSILVRLIIAGSFTAGTSFPCHVSFCFCLAFWAHARFFNRILCSCLWSISLVFYPVFSCSQPFLFYRNRPPASFFCRYRYSLALWASILAIFWCHND